MKIVASLLLTAAIGAGLTGAQADPSHAAPSRVRIEPSKIDAALNGFIRSKALVGVSALVWWEDRIVVISVNPLGLRQQE